MAKFGSALTADRFTAQEMIKEAVANSKNLAEAMESVGAMYGIPSSNILVDNNLKSVKVVNDTVITPANVSATNNVNTIVRSISTVLDNISARINEKLDAMQMPNIEAGRMRDEVTATADPSKGKVVATYNDSDGATVIVYDTGIIDAPNTPAGRAKADELRAMGNVPTIDPIQKKPSYFSDEDNVMAGVNATAEPATNLQLESAYDIASIINESEYFIDAMAKFGDTSALGTTILTRHGYERILPTMNVVQEAAIGKKKTIRPEDIKHMKFDNKNIIKAVEYFNKARAEQPVKNVVDLDIPAFINNPNYKKAIDCLEKQFDCHLAVKWVNGNNEESSAFTMSYTGEYRNKLTVSKSKGFQLGGSPIYIAIIGDGITSLTADDKVFGQGVVSIFLHEIFHNIAGIIRYDNGEMITTLAITLEEAIKTKDPQTRKKLVERYVGCMNAKLGGKLGKIGKKMMVSRMLALVAAEGDERRMTQIDQALEKDTGNNGGSYEANRALQRHIKAYKKLTKATKANEKVFNFTSFISILGGCIVLFMTVIAPLLAGAGITIGGSLIGLLFFFIGFDVRQSYHNYMNMIKKYKNSREMEEYYADLMSAMYQLPQRFFIGGKKYNVNDVDKKLLDEWVEVEKIAYETIMSIYPTSSERTWAGVTVAKKLLECKGLDKNIKSYLNWVVENNDNILKTNIKTNYNKTTFDPEEAEDLDKHLTSLIKNNNITTSEAAIDYLMDSSEFSEWVLNGMPYDTEDTTIIEAYIQEQLCEDVMLEYTAVKATGYKHESTIKRIILFLPRLLLKACEVINNFIERFATIIINGIYSVITDKNQTYTINRDIKKIAEGLEAHKEYINTIADSVSNISNESEFNTVFSGDGIKWKEYANATDKVREILSKQQAIEIKGSELVDAYQSINKNVALIDPRLRRIKIVIDKITRDLDPSKIDEKAKDNLQAFINEINSISKFVQMAADVFIMLSRTKAGETEAGSINGITSVDVLKKQYVWNYIKKYESGIKKGNYKAFMIKIDKNSDPELIKSANIVFHKDQDEKYLLVGIAYTEKANFQVTINGFKHYTFFKYNSMEPALEKLFKGQKEARIESIE